MPYHNMEHAQNMGPNLFACNENHAYIMPGDTACAVMSCAHHAVHAHRQAGRPDINVACQKILMDMLFAPAEQYLLTASHFSTLNKNWKPECAEKDSHCHPQ